MKILKSSTYNQLLKDAEFLRSENKTLSDLLSVRDSQLAEQKEKLRLSEEATKDALKKLMSSTDERDRLKKKVAKLSKEVSHLEQQIRRLKHEV